MTYDDATTAHRSISWFDGKDFDGHTIKVQMPSADEKRIFLELPSWSSVLTLWTFDFFCQLFAKAQRLSILQAIYKRKD